MLYFMSFIYSLLNKMKFIYLEIKITMPTIPDEIFGRLTQVYGGQKTSVCLQFNDSCECFCVST